MFLAYGDLDNSLPLQSQHRRGVVALRVAPTVGAPEVDLVLRKFAWRGAVHNVEQATVANVGADGVLVWDGDACLTAQVHAVNRQHLPRFVVEVAKHLLDGNRGTVLEASVLGQPGLDPGWRTLSPLILHVDLEPLLLVRLDELGLEVLFVVFSGLSRLSVGGPLSNETLVGVACHALDLRNLLGVVPMERGRLFRHVCKGKKNNGSLANSMR
mmetsp:Transcript_23263/g.51060  ORF Transcript_23263/g.51060 Transcript_23263/m.51060 type:complete len:213 (-) Transcript_23263:155-793(-)